MLVAVFLAVAPLPVDNTAALTVGLVALVFYAVEALGALYDLGSVIAQEVRA